MTEKNPASEQHLTRKDLNTLWYRYVYSWFSSSSYEKLQAHAMAYSYIPFAEKYYADDPEGKIRLLTRHSQFWNSEPQVGMVINGIVASLEEDILFRGEVSEDMPSVVKTTLMGPLASLGDSFIQGIIVPTLLSIGMSLSASGSPSGAIFYLVTYVTFSLVMQYFLFNYGYKMGLGAVDVITGENSRRLMDAVNILGIIVIGTLAAANVSVATTIQIPFGDSVAPLQDTLDGVFPCLLALIVTLLSWWLLKKKGLTATKVLIVQVVAVIVLCVIGVL